MKINNCMVDWLEISLFDVTLSQVYTYLNLDCLTFEHRTSAYYKDVYIYDNCITVMANLRLRPNPKLNRKDIDEHIHIKISGKGCRFLEKLYGTSDLRYELRRRIVNPEQYSPIRFKVSRMDLCIDYDSKFVNDFVQDALHYRFDGIKKRKIIISDGTTIYLGSTTSEKFIRMYEKDIESGEPSKFKDRVELVLKNKYATFEFENENENVDIVSTYMYKIEWLNENMMEVWNSMVKKTCEVSPTIRHKKTTLAEKRDYILATYGATLRAAAKTYGSLAITKGIEEAVYSQKDLRLIQNAKVIDIIRGRRKNRQKVETAAHNAEKSVKYSQVSM